MMEPLCSRHPAAASHLGHCPACLIEEALAPARDEGTGEIHGCTIHVPLGSGPVTSVFVVQSRVALRRLKRWRVPAPPDFLDRFEDLRRKLEGWKPASIPLPLEAAVDGEGYPAVLSEFRQGMPLADCLAAGRLGGGDARLLLQQLAAVLTSAHDRGLAHGSVVPGNIMVGRDGVPFLVDFGMAAALAPPATFADWVARDRDGCAARTAELNRLAGS